jgi:hypothetical protein
MRLSALLLILLLSGCGVEPPQAWFSTYLARLGRVLDQPVPPVAASDARAAFPARRELRALPRQDSIGLLDFLSLQGCALQQVVGERNSALGRVAGPSTDLVFELRFLALAPACAAVLREAGEQALADRLDGAAAGKRAALPASIWRALLGSDEYRQFWRAPRQLADYPVQANLPVDDVLLALDGLARQWLAGDYRVDVAVLEGHLRQLSLGDGGALYAGLALQSSHLAAADALVGARLSDRALCVGAGSEAGPVARNVVNRFFIGAIQPWSARLNARRLRLLPLVRRLEATLRPGETPAFAAWRLYRDERLQRWSGAPARHVAALLPLLEQCGVAPQQAAVLPARLAAGAVI